MKKDIIFLQPVFYGKGEVPVKIGIVSHEGTPLFLPADRKFEEDEILTVDGGVFGTMNITIKDRRDPAVCIPGWKPRVFFMEEGYLR